MATYTPAPINCKQFDPITPNEQVALLRNLLAEAASVIMRCIGEGADFEGDVEDYAGKLLSVAIPD